MLAAQRGEREEAEAPETVVEGDQDDALLGELDPRKVGLGATAEHEGAAVDPDHDRHLCSKRCPGRSPHIEKQAIFRRGPGDQRRASWKCRLRTLRAKLA